MNPLELYLVFGLAPIVLFQILYALIMARADTKAIERIIKQARESEEA